MRGRLVRGVLTLGVLCAPASGAAVESVDDAGRTVRLAEPATRIVSLAPHITETLFAIGAGDRIVGADRHSDHPPEAASIEKLGGYKRIDVERVLTLDPDLVIVWQTGTPQKTVETLKATGLTVYVSYPQRMTAVPRLMESLGALTGLANRARRVAERWREELARLRARFEAAPPVRVMYQVSDRPIITLNNRHLISDVIRLCGGRNVFGTLGSLAPRVGAESVLEAAPQVIVASPQAGKRPQWLDNWRQWPELPAVRHDQLQTVEAGLIQRHGPRIVEGARRMCRILDEARTTCGD